MTGARSIFPLKVKGNVPSKIAKNIKSLRLSVFLEIVCRNAHQFYPLYGFAFENQSILRIGFAQILAKGGFAALLHK